MLALMNDTKYLLTLGEIIAFSLIYSGLLALGWIMFKVARRRFRRIRRRYLAGRELEAGRYTPLDEQE